MISTIYICINITVLSLFGGAIGTHVMRRFHFRCRLVMAIVPSSYSCWLLILQIASSWTPRAFRLAGD